MSKKRALVVGRHEVYLGRHSENYEIVGQENIKFSKNAHMAKSELSRIISLAQFLNAEIVLFQNTPTIITRVLIDLVYLKELPSLIRFGVIVPADQGPRIQGAINVFPFSTHEDAKTAANAISFVNKRADVLVKGSALEVVVDPVPPFVFGDIIWLKPEVYKTDLLISAVKKQMGLRNLFWEFDSLAGKISLVPKVPLLGEASVVVTYDRETMDKNSIGLQITNESLFNSCGIFFEIKDSHPLNLYVLVGEERFVLEITPYTMPSGWGDEEEVVDFWLL